MHAGRRGKLKSASDKERIADGEEKFAYGKKRKDKKKKKVLVLEEDASTNEGTSDDVLVAFIQ